MGALSKAANFYWRLRANYSRYIWSVIRFVPNQMNQYVSPWWTAYVDARRAAGYSIKGYIEARDDRRSSIALGHVVRPQPNDPAIFLARLANRCAAPDAWAAKSLNLFVVGDENSDLRAYTCLPYLFGRLVNINFVKGGTEFQALLSTLQSSRLADEIRTDTQEPLTEIALADHVPGLVRLPQIFVNQAREYLKSLSWSARYCALSLSGEGEICTYVDASRDLAQSHPAWRFIILGPGALALDLSRELPPNVVVPARSGLGFLTQIALATQADVYFGDADSFGITSTIAGLPVTLLSGGNGAPLAAKTNGNVCQVRRAENNIADLRMLLDG
jgi:hypothetical protein